MSIQISFILSVHLSVCWSAADRCNSPRAHGQCSMIRLKFKLYLRCFKSIEIRMCWCVDSHLEYNVDIVTHKNSCQQWIISLFRITCVRPDQLSCLNQLKKLAELFLQPNCLMDWNIKSREQVLTLSTSFWIFWIRWFCGKNGKIL